MAIKVLPEEFAENEERLARFKREAKVLASLNHPNIAAIYGLEQFEGTHYLVLELVPGETLAQRISRGPIPVDEALPLFVQIAEGLEAAHEKGVIHRDLKPGNVMVTTEGKPKILDFGLAKALKGEGQGQDLSQSPTLTKDATEVGVLLGTAPYMSPEQARGQTLDKRSDIWAFGCCLYEAVTGKAAFLGETVSDTLAKVLEREPDWDALPTSIPILARSLLLRCLRKDRDQRCRDMGDVRIEIDEALTSPSTISEGSGVGRRLRQRDRLLMLIMVMGLVVIILAGIGGWWLRGRGSQKGPRYPVLRSQFLWWNPRTSVVGSLTK